MNKKRITRSIITLIAFVVVSGAGFGTAFGYGGGGGGGGGGGNGPIVGSFGAPTGQVLGASTTTVPTKPTATTTPTSSGVTPTTPVSCTAPLTSYMRYGKKNDPTQVARLQIFLKAHGYTVAVNGIFDLATRAAVKSFQLDHAAEVLTPWGITKPTGYVFKTTEWEINKIACPTSVIAAPQL